MPARHRRAPICGRKHHNTCQRIGAGLFTTLGVGSAFYACAFGYLTAVVYSGRYIAWTDADVHTAAPVPSLAPATPPGPAPAPTAP